MWSRVIFLRDGVHSQTDMEINAEKSSFLIKGKNLLLFQNYSIIPALFHKGILFQNNPIGNAIIPSDNPLLLQVKKFQRDFMAVKGSNYDETLKTANLFWSYWSLARQHHRFILAPILDGVEGWCVYASWPPPPSQFKYGPDMRTCS